MSKRIDITGERYGRLTAIEFVRFDGKYTYWKFKCDCGNSITTRLSSVRCGDTKSCGCLGKEIIERQHVGTHNGSGTRLYSIWRGMKKRCYSPKTHEYENYGGAGISVCFEWKDSFENFRDWAMSHGYAEGLTIDRIDNEKGYCPENCRWATMREQIENRRNTIRILYNGEILPVARVAEIVGCSYDRVYKAAKSGCEVFV